MTNEERWIIEGRTRERLRELKRAIALAEADIQEHAVNLKEAQAALEQFLRDPAGSSPTGKSKSEYLLTFFAAFLPADVISKINQLAADTMRAKELEEQIKRF